MIHRNRSNDGGGIIDINSPEVKRLLDGKLLECEGKLMQGYERCFVVHELSIFFRRYNIHAINGCFIRYNNLNLSLQVYCSNALPGHNLTCLTDLFNSPELHTYRASSGKHVEVSQSDSSSCGTSASDDDSSALSSKQREEMPESNVNDMTSQNSQRKPLVSLSNAACVAESSRRRTHA